MISAQRAPYDERSDAEIYRDLVELCVLAEELGFDSAWLSEHHFVDDGYMPSLLPVAAAIAARTSTLTVGTGILVAPLHDPIRLAEDAATVDVLSGGRLVLGIGAGYRDEEFAGFGKANTGLGAVLDHTLATLRAAWSPTGTVQLTPDSAPVRVTPKPVQAGGPPIWIGARTRAGIRRTATAADGLIAARVSPDELAAQVAQLHAEADASGRDRDELSVAVHCPVLAWNDGPAWDVLEQALHYSEWKYGDMVRQPYGERDPETLRARPGELRDEVRDTIRAGALVGTPEQVVEQVTAYVRATGGARTTFIPRLWFPGLDAEVQRESMRIFATQVAPAVREALAVAG
jgi:alkanesulfonate monooxygenase SsuD/methylene tetrahydromethanopterin reductase-like flavin-dependent oxidoreductase (luciferase family)